MSTLRHHLVSPLQLVAMATRHYSPAARLCHRASPLGRSGRLEPPVDDAYP